MVASKLRQLNPTVHCGGDAMTLHVEGNVMSDFMIDGGSYPDLVVEHLDYQIISPV